MPFGRGTHVVPGNIVLDSGPGTLWEGEILGSELPVCNDIAYRQITLALVFSAYEMRGC